MCKLKRSLIYCLSICFFWGNMLTAQVSDDFSDGEITSNPAWSGDLSHFQVNSLKKLQLNAPAAGNSAVVVPLAMPDSAVWRLGVQLGFAPSATNRLRLYLLADAPDLSVANGYFLEIGENGSADALKLFRQDGGTATLLATGTPGLVAADTLSCSLIIRRSGLGEWSVDFEPSGGPTYTSELFATDATYGAGANRYFGIGCVYTATRTTKFHFDNLSIEADLPDVMPPVLESVAVSGQQQLLLTFNELPDTTVATDESRYILLPQGDMPLQAVLQGDGKTVQLTFNQPFYTGSYTIHCEGMTDPSGNVAALQTLSFDHVAVEKAVEYDVLINEIMADPSPSAGLPEVEWIELYNRSAKYLELSNLLLDDGSGPLTLPAGVLTPGSFVVLASPTNAAVLVAAGIQALAVPGLPSLNNDGDLIRIYLADGSIIDQVAYTGSWHDDASKQDGGWSLERIDPTSPCLGAANWRSCSLSIGGGTPGMVNASFDGFSDTVPPKALSVFTTSTTELSLRFSEGLDQSSAVLTGQYELEPAMVVVSVALSAEDKSQLTLSVGEDLQTGIVYRLIILNGLVDCAGNASLVSDTLLFGLPEKPEAGDVVFSEILFNPLSGGSDYVELYNRSEKIFSWNGFFLDNSGDANGATPLHHERLFLPGDYMALSSDRSYVLDRYANVDPNRLFEQNLPSLPDEKGNIALLWSDGSDNLVVDGFDYDEAYHNNLLGGSDREGVPLERLDMEQQTNLASNWTSAAQFVSGLPGTPTQPNSQKSSPTTNSNELVVLPVNRLSPDGDGREDFLEIQYNTPSSGYAATLTVFDSWGIPVRQLIRQSLVNTAGQLRWDGDDDAGALVRPGIYVLFMEIFSPEGEVQKVKKTVAVVGKF
ncbi:MAG: lamin tail domain-containing protein [Saprospiraceae bacterium]|nr:lamin tail domain-containing protein [Saprospiraceae bacterium]MCC6414230.1 lamin tail domain-containing protein [Saprospiraceae bacterium]